MPELPEVETIRLQLEKYLNGHTILEVHIEYDKMFSGDKKNIEGGKVKSVRRFGKALTIDLDNDYSLVVHIKMTGQFIYRGPKLKGNPKLSLKVTGGVPGKHTHTVFNLDDGGILYYNDVRKFGWMRVVKTAEVKDVDFIKKLGPEFLDGMTNGKFKKLLSTTGRAIKTLLMDQSKVAGVGNIYANDALFLAKVNPEAKANKLPEDQADQLYEAIETVLKRGLKYGGASELAYVTPDGSEGEYQNHSLIYGKANKKCPNKCGETIKRIVVGGRGTFFCPKCQKQ